MILSGVENNANGFCVTGIPLADLFVGWVFHMSALGTRLQRRLLPGPVETCLQYPRNTRRRNRLFPSLPVEIPAVVPFRNYGISTRRSLCNTVNRLALVHPRIHGQGVTCIWRSVSLCVSFPVFCLLVPVYVPGRTVQKKLGQPVPESNFVLDWKSG